MSVDWNDLNNKTNGFRNLTYSTDPSGVVLDAICSGLYLNLSDVVAKFAKGQSAAIAIFVDTLVIDVPQIDARGMSVLARNIDVSKLPKQTLQLPVVSGGGSRIIEVLAGATSGGSLQLAPAVSKPVPFTVPVGLDALQAVFYSISPDGKVVTTVEKSASYLADLIGRPLALNSFMASFTAASWLMQSSDPKDSAVAASMLNWIVTCVRALGMDGATIPANFADLYSQAAALLVTLNVSPGAYYVPVLSSAFYKQRGDELLNVLQSYQSSLDTLSVQTDIKKAIQDVSTTLEGVAQDEAGPSQTELDQISQNLDSLSSEIRALGGQYAIQFLESKTRFALLQNAIAQERVNQWLNACLQMGLAAMDLGVVAGKAAAGKAEPGDAASAIKTGIGAIKTAISAIETLMADAPSPTLNDRATQLMRMQEALMTSYIAGALVWDSANKNDGTAPDLPASLAAVQVDPSLAWDNYMVEADAAVNNIGGPAPETRNYLASLKILAQYGKAIDSKIVIYSSQLARAAVVKAQIRAAQNVKARWDQLAAAAQSDQEKLAALRGLIQSRSDSVKRSLYVAWTQYRESYRYLYFAPPPVALNMDMSVSALKAAFTQVAGWVAQLLGDDPSVTRVQLPADNVQISFRFKIVKSGTQLTDTQIALLEPGDGGQTPKLSWTIPFADSQLKGVLPNQGKVAIWIKDAKFFLAGVNPNAQGRVIVNVSTSGSYQNGYDPAKALSFVMKSLAGDYAYVVDEKSVYIPWSIDTGVYQTPTPFTQWTMVFDPDGGDPSNASELRMDLKVAYRGGAIGQSA